MAFFSACKPMFRAYASNSQSETNFEANNHTVGKLIQIDVAPTFKEGTLYGDDDVAEHKKVYNYADITLNTTTLPKDAAKVMFGLGGTTKLEYNKNSESKYGKFGYIYGEVVDGANKYVVVILPRVQFDVPSTSYQTEGENIEFGTPSITGRAYADGTTGNWKEEDDSYTTLSAALTALETAIGGTSGTAGDGGGEVIPDGDEDPEGSPEEA